MTVIGQTEYGMVSVAMGICGASMAALTIGGFYCDRFGDVASTCLDQLNGSLASAVDCSDMSDRSWTCLSEASEMLFGGLASMFSLCSLGSGVAYCRARVANHRQRRAEALLL